MIFDRRGRAPLTADVASDRDLATADLEIAVDGQWYPATWTGDSKPHPTQEGWFLRTGETTADFAGPDGLHDGDVVVLPLGRHLTALRAHGAVSRSTPIDVQ